MSSETNAQLPRFSIRSMLAATLVACVLLAPIPWLGFPYVLHVALAGLVLAFVFAFLWRQRTDLAIATLLIGLVAAVLLFVPGLMLGTFLSLFAVGFSYRVNHLWKLRAVLCFTTMAVGVVPAILTHARALREVDQMIAAYPFESLRDRSPNPPEGSPPDPIDVAPDREVHLAALEQGIEDGWRNRRSWMLERLHQESYRRFASSPGFGFARMIRVQPYHLAVDPPESDAAPMGLAGFEKESPPGELHQAVYLNMFASGPMGFTRSVDEVAGFRPHALRGFAAGHADQSPPAYELEKIELVGLLLSDEPRVYQAGRFPRMDRLAESPTRDLDAFETAGIQHIRRGNELYQEETASGFRMLGAVRAVKSCTDCHDTPRGALLGAFSYWVTAVEKES